MIKKIKKTLTNLTGHVGRRISRPKKIDKETEQKKSKSDAGKSQAKVLMFGWELPPFNSGGLGVACYELAQSLTGKNTAVTFVLPRKIDIKVPFMKVAYAQNTEVKQGAAKHGDYTTTHKGGVKIRTIESPLSPYLNENSYLKIKDNRKDIYEQLKYDQGSDGTTAIYGSDLIAEVMRYGEAAVKIVMEENFNVIHAHDWLSYPAGIKAKKVSGKPLITHVHAIEYDRSHELGVNHQICAIEKAGLEAADKVIAVSDYTRHRINQYYGIPLDKIEVVHNGIKIDHKPAKKLTLKGLKSGGKKMVLFVGRITYQKGVDYFIEAAYKALQINPKIVFMVVGSGDMMYQIIEQAAHFGISDKVFFPGFLRGQDLENIYQAADLYVMPSVSEPFGLVALEALSLNVPVIVSKQSGASEVLRHSLKVDFWDTDEMANKIVAVINNSSLHKSLAKYGHQEALNCTWDLAADKCVRIYNQLALS